MLISAIQRFTMLDYPGKTSCIVFVPGCNMRCRFCHNPEFVLPEMIQEIKKSFISTEAFFNFLDQRVDKLDGVTISGGEPTIMPDLPDFIRKIKDKGFLVKLDSNGNNPKMLKQLIDEKLLDYIAMDVKSDLDNYIDLARGTVKTENITESIRLIMSSGTEYEFRTTVIKESHPEYILKNIADMITGAEAYYLQEFRPGQTIDPEFSNKNSYTREELENIAKNIFSSKVKKVEVRAE